MPGVYAIKPLFQQALRPVEDWLVARGVHPDWLTLTALALAVGGGGAIALSPAWPPLLLLVPVVAVVRLGLNALDGLVARRLGLARPWGEVLNEVCDRLADIALIGALLLLPNVPTLLGAAALAAMLAASFVGLAGKAAGGRRQYGGAMGKADRMLLLAATAPLALVAGPALVFSATLALIGLGALLTAAQRLRAIHAELTGP
jgi:CDP-diacylglycerol--glycerol-3-phosphate 3-phosphatidyltransferase